MVGGKTAIKGFWPWQVAIWYKGAFKCGGTLVNERFVVTAAHCIPSRNVEGYEIVLGDHNRLVDEKTEQKVRAKKIIVHPHYKPTVRNDIALIEMDQDAILTTYITPACLPSATEEISAGAKCFITGRTSTFYLAVHLSKYDLLVTCAVVNNIAVNIVASIFLLF